MGDLPVADPGAMRVSLALLIGVRFGMQAAACGMVLLSMSAQCHQKANTGKQELAP